MFVVGYGSQLSVAPGETLDFMVSTDARELEVDVVRLIRGGIDGWADGMIEQPITSEIAGRYPGREQMNVAGSYVHGTFSQPVPLFGVGMAVWVFPTILEHVAEQVLLEICGPGDEQVCMLSLLEGSVAFVFGTGEGVQSEFRLEQDRWHYVVASYDPRAGRISVGVGAHGRFAEALQWTHADVGNSVWIAKAESVTVAARLSGGRGGQCFNGKLAEPTVWARPLRESDILGWRPARNDAYTSDGPIVAFDFSMNQSGLSVADRSGQGITARCFNMPTRAVTGPWWDGTETSWRMDPNQWSAIHFHDDDVGDVGWERDVTLRVPANWQSGVYALRVRAEGSVDRIPFVVRDSTPSTADSVLIVLPTWTYMAYANWRTYLEDQEVRAELYGERRPFDPRDGFLVDHPELGKSLYDVHRDGSGVAYSSRLRPILNMRPDYFTPTTKGLRHFAADLWLLWWLERVQDIRYTVATDEDLHERGAELLRRYPTMITGSHPEYVSGRMRIGIAEYVSSGGRVMYLGGNGFYWVTNRHAEEPGTIEIRRGGHGGVWRSSPGEACLSTTGEVGGRWRDRGRYPQELVGVGMRAQGFDRAEGYRRTQDSYLDACSWIFEGVAGEVFGDHAIGLDGAAGDEIDAAASALGTSSDAYIVARSFGHSPRMKLTDDEVYARNWETGADAAAQVHSDVVYWPTRNGAVFSVGSMCWLSALAWNHGDNDVSTVTANVLRRFMTPNPLPRPS